MSFLDSIKKYFNYQYNFVNNYNQREALLYIKRNKVLLKVIDKDVRKDFEDEFLNLVDNEINKKHRNLNEDEVNLLVNRLRIKFLSRMRGDIDNTIIERLNLLANELRIIQKYINSNNQNIDLIQLNKLISKIQILISKNSSVNFIRTLIPLSNQINQVLNDLRTFRKTGIKNNLSNQIDSILKSISNSSSKFSEQQAAK